MSSIRFESSWKKDKERDAIRSAREAVLASAEAKGLREAERRKKEDSWMLPNLDKSLDASNNEKKSRKRKKKDKKSKKHKKEKKSKKKKHKERSSSSSSSSESDAEDEWVEKPSVSTNKSPVRQQRESWMDFGLMAQVSAMSRNSEPSKKSQKTIDRELKEEEHRKESLKRELNPNIRREHNLPVERSSSREEREKSDQQRAPTPAGNSWIERAYHRIKEQAEREGKSVEEVAKERWGSLDKFKSLLGKIEEDKKAKVDENKKDDIRSESKSRTGWKTDSRKEQDKVKSMRPNTQERDRSPHSSRETKDSKVDENVKEPGKEDAPENQPKVVMTEKEMNALGAKIVKAELMGNLDKAKKLKEKLEEARAANEMAKASGRPIETETETVVLTRTDSKGLVRPIQADVATDVGKSRKGKVQTHADGQRVRYFADDDRFDLKQMYEREKLSTAEDQNMMMSRLAGKAIERTDDDDYSIDDLFTSRAAKKRSEDQDLKQERDKAIAEHREMTKTLDDCRFCFDGAEFKKHLMVSIGKSCYLSLPPHTSLTEDHCRIIPMSHITSGTLLDENVFEEMQAFRKALCKMFESEDRDCVFYEIATGLKRHPHMVLECVPLPKEAGELAPMYFQKAIQESESEWSHNKKLINLTQEKNIRRSIPKGLPYFHVDFGMQNGFAHVIEDEQIFPRNFAPEVIGGMLDLEPRVWRHPKREPFELQKKKVLSFGAKWKRFDFTRRDSSSSSDSDD